MTTEPTDHLPECPSAASGVPSCICDDYEECGPQCRHNCICAALRACEQRVADEMWRGWEQGVIYQAGQEYGHEQGYVKGAADERAKWVNDGCVWGEGECVPDCPSCKRMDDLYAERVAGAREEAARIRQAVANMRFYTLDDAQRVLSIIDGENVTP